MMDFKIILKRIYSLGPMVALTLSSLVVTSASYSAIQIYGLPGMKLIKTANVFVMYPEALWVLYIYFSVMAGPGFVQTGWAPKQKQDERFLPYCDVCKGFKAPRSHHCKSCGHCVLKMDHHCCVINTCVGHENLTGFIALLFFLAVGCVHVIVLNVLFLYKLFSRAYLLNMKILPINTYTILLVNSGIAFSIGAGLGFSVLLVTQLKGVFKNRTHIESLICDKAWDRRKRNKDLPDFIYPYDLGWKKNFRQVVSLLSLSPVGNGYRWPVVEGCNQYTLTIEQIDQKKDKASYFSYKVIKSFTGRKFSTSNGIMTCLTMPCLDPGLCVDEGETILVTQTRKYWVYGSKMESGSHSKGWIPRACVNLRAQSSSREKKRE